jgi:hypothetical protein
MSSVPPHFLHSVVALSVVDMLRVFEAKALAAALTEAGYSVSERTVQRWKAGQTRPKPQDIRAIRDLVGASEANERAASPSMTRRLLAGVIALETAAGITPEALAAAQQEATGFEERALDVDRRVAAELTETQRKAAERKAGQVGGQSAVLPGSKRSKR